jgi:hypothetical protein
MSAYPEVLYGRLLLQGGRRPHGNHDGDGWKSPPGKPVLPDREGWCLGDRYCVFLIFLRRLGREAVLSSTNTPGALATIDSVIDGDQCILGVGHHAKFRHIESPFFRLSSHPHRFYLIDD